ncbi:RlpA-like double-psi beta-barrel-protein domain-containing protein-containing protein [Mycotypha africana]|uniref:RlpA-like double-psi beta-barrel-protein domain-containing protein-containing protein n=1 Tax=Mycotypha africana TaxID=64632 RepID=UPI002300A571|nr:RlpA-like double-psi beta-barrel-protein domain-containing protein-containing protein [Mycotypha africana]KAI8988372.1 RlpA-like double-psi beta-barrel-protein domain-containing protein-containing protein [Mycotypha africana]
MFRVTFLFAVVLAVLAVVSQAANIEARGNKHHGTATFYSVKHSGKPSCGYKADNDDMVAALSHKRMPKHGHGKPCGEKVKVHYKKKSITVKVIDTCDGCGRNDIDLSPAAFKKLDHKKKGELKVQWEFK